MLRVMRAFLLAAAVSSALAPRASAELFGPDGKMRVVGGPSVGPDMQQSARLPDADGARGDPGFTPSGENKVPEGASGGTSAPAEPPPANEDS